MDKVQACPLGKSIVFVSMMALTFGQTYITRLNGENERTTDELWDERLRMDSTLDVCAAVFMKNTITTQRKRTLYSAQTIVPSV